MTVIGREVTKFFVVVCVVIIMSIVECSAIWIFYISTVVGADNFGRKREYSN